MALRFWLLTLAAMALTGPAQAEDRFSPNNPTFSQFKQTCRIGQSSIVEECKGGVLDSYASYAGTKRDRVTCDYAAFWADADKVASRIIDVLPWQSVIEQLVTDPGVCRVEK